jgi:transcriptional regulator with XRE-family HTH domain
MTGCCGLVKGFGATVRRLREARQWSQEMLAERADLNRSYIGEIERGSVVASILTVQKLAAAFGIPSSGLLAHTEAANTGQMVKGIELTSIAC